MSGGGQGCMDDDAEDPFDFTASEIRLQGELTTPTKPKIALPVDVTPGKPSSADPGVGGSSGTPKPAAAISRDPPPQPRQKVTKELPCCVLCVHPRANGKTPYCGPHRRGHDNLQNQGVYLKKKYGDTSEQYKLWEMYWARGSAAQRHKAIIKYTQLFGDKTNKAGIRRGELDFTEYQHIFRESVSREETDSHWRVEWEVFMNRMKADRGWSVARAQEVWDELLNDAAIHRDYEGFKGAMRLWVPPNLASTSFVSNKHSKTEEKLVAQRTRLAQDEDAASACKNELGTGFSKDWTEAAAASYGLTASAPSGGWSERHKSSFQSQSDLAMNIMTGVAKEFGAVGVETETAATPSSSKTGAPAPATAASSVLGSSAEVAGACPGGEDPRKPMPRKVVDVALQRVDLQTKCLREVDARNSDLLRLLAEAVECIMMWHGSRCVFHVVK